MHKNHKKYFKPVFHKQIQKNDAIESNLISFTVGFTSCPSFTGGLAVKRITAFAIGRKANPNPTVKEDICLVNKFKNIGLPSRGKSDTVCKQVYLSPFVSVGINTAKIGF